MSTSLVVALQPRLEHRLRVLGGLRRGQLIGVRGRRRTRRLGHEAGVVRRVRGGCVEEPAQHIEDVLIGGHPGDKGLEKLEEYSVNKLQIPLFRIHNRT